jgi:N-acetylmuramoyl-L-alanine amidase
MRPSLLFVALLVLAGCTAAESGEIANEPFDASITTATPTTVATTMPPVTTTTTTTITSTTTTTTAAVPIGVPEEPRPGPAAPVAHIVDGFDGSGVVTVAAGGADLYRDQLADPFVTAREGLVFPAVGEMSGDWIQLFTSCDERAWVHSSQVMARPPAGGGDLGSGFDFANATIVLDPGHGGPYNTGAASPSGLVEKSVNLDIAQRARDLLSEPHTIDWATGEIYTGDEIPAAGWVLMTRVGDGDDADYEAGLTYRTTLANAANADAMVAIHNNAGWEVRMDMPGSDVYYQSQLGESRRFARIMVDELQRSFDVFQADWVGALESGAKSRLSPQEDNPQYYGILRRAQMPAVIVEGAFISNPSEAALLATAEFRQAYAEAVYRALIRFMTTDDTGASSDSDPVIWYGDAGSGDARPQCVIPAEGEG